MWYVIGCLITISLVAGAIWLRNRWVVDTFNSYGVYGSMAGLHLYKKFGLWHVGNRQTEEPGGEKGLSRSGISKPHLKSAER